MKKLKHISIFLVFFFGACSNVNNTIIETETKTENCPCDSIKNFKTNGKYTSYAYLGKSQITISHLPDNDTMEVTRRYTTDSVWHFQEFLVVVNNKLVAPDFALYCDIEDTAEFYRLTHIRNEDRFIKQGVITHGFSGVNVVLDKDTFSSKTLSVLVPKERFKGIITIDKVLDITYKGKRRGTLGRIYIEAESMIKYGNLLEQYKTIKRLCK